MKNQKTITVEAHNAILKNKADARKGGIIFFVSFITFVSSVAYIGLTFFS